MAESKTTDSQENATTDKSAESKKSSLTATKAPRKRTAVKSVKESTASSSRKVPVARRKAAVSSDSQTKAGRSKWNDIDPVLADSIKNGSAASKDEQVAWSKSKETKSAQEEQADRSSQTESMESLEKTEKLSPVEDQSTTGRSSSKKASATKADSAPEPKNGKLMVRPVTEEIPVEGVTIGIVNALGDMVGGFVKTGKRTKAVLGRGVDRITGDGASESTAKSAQKDKTDTKNPFLDFGKSVPDGLKAVVGGFSTVLKGGAEIVVGTVGCLGGTAVCIYETVTGVIKKEQGDEKAKETPIVGLLTDQSSSKEK
ncbi:MAG: hypothetical protein HQL67_03870 [Magnetococcales bacterium]|nr:hypothetical protein [Magnetococcales bacterium]